MENIEKYKLELSKKQELLNNAISLLKKEFVGIDSVIDRITASISSWFFFPEMQERPVIINLWGLTGIGKTSVVKRLAELIEFAEHYFHYDLGESSKKYYDMQDSFKEIYDNCDGEPFIIGLDEFQLARTINEDREEIDRASIRALWDLLDCGKFDIVDFEYSMGWFGKLIKKLDLALYKGVEVEHGIVISEKEIYNKLMSISNEDDDEDEDDENDEKKDVKENKELYFVSDSDVTSIYNLSGKLFLTQSELRDKLNEMDGDQTIDYLIKLYKLALKPKTVDCTKALVFIMGNLDEVYTMSRDFNPDISANEFHRQSKEITITEIKKALLSRFRSEQIARLGNNHIIYPSFNEESFYKIIHMELDKVKQKVAATYGLKLLFDEQIERLIYAEGVFPTQGTRPLFTTVQQIVNTRLGKILNEIYLNGVNADSIVFSVNEEEANTEQAEIGRASCRERV